MVSIKTRASVVNPDFCMALGRLGYIPDDPDRSDNPVDWKLSFAAKPKKTIVSASQFFLSEV